MALSRPINRPIKATDPQVVQVFQTVLYECTDRDVRTYLAGIRPESLKRRNFKALRRLGLGP